MPAFITSALKENGITVLSAHNSIVEWGLMGGPIKPSNGTAGDRRWLVRCEAPWDQYNWKVMPGIYLDAFDSVADFVARYRKRYPAGQLRYREA